MFVFFDWFLKVLIEGDDLFVNVCSMLFRLNLFLFFLLLGKWSFNIVLCFLEEFSFVYWYIVY